MHRLVSSSVLVLVTFPLIAWCQETGETLATPASQAVQGSENKARQGISPEARAAVQKGTEQLQSKQFKDAVQTFLAAARRHPNSGQLRHLLGFAYAQDKQFGPAWLQLRKAVRLQPGYEPAVRDFLKLWTDFDSKGVLSIGVAKPQIVRYLGEPDNQSGDANRSVVEYGFMQLHFVSDRLFAIVDPRGLDPEVSRPLNVLQIEFDDKSRWRLGYRAINRLQSLTEYVPRQESVQSWKELYTVQRLYDLASKTTTETMAQKVEENLRKRNPDIDFQVLAKSDSEILFHWREQATKENPGQHEIVRLVTDEKDIHRLAYSRRVPQIPNEEAQAWFSLLREAKLVPPEAPSTTSPAGASAAE